MQNTRAILLYLFNLLTSRINSFIKTDRVGLNEYEIEIRTHGLLALSRDCEKKTKCHFRI